MKYTSKNKVVIVTGGANGIGYEIVNQYLENGAKVVVIVDIDEIQGNKVIKIITERYGKDKAHFIKCDVTTDLEPVSKYIFERYKSVDVLVLNAGMANPTVPRKMIDIYVTSVIEWCMKFLEHMGKDKAGNGGTFVINSSVFGLRTIPHAPIYQASKFAVVGFAKSLGHVYNFERTGVRVLTICPGFTKTNLTLPVYDPELKKMYPDQDLIKFADAYPWQKSEAVGKAVIEIYEKAKSGTVWVIEGEILSEVV